MSRYKRNGILPMLKRNLGVKTAPQRWQENAADGVFDVVITFEEKVFDMVMEGWCTFSVYIFSTSFLLLIYSLSTLQNWCLGYCVCI